jgi:hypothetical protein
MEKRRSSRPLVVEALEGRVALSHGGAVAGAAVHLKAAANPLPNVSNTPVRGGPVGALGDDFTDEYRFYPPDRSVARNWVEILHATREVAFGPFSLRSRGEPRNQGFAYNWARSGATTADMVRDQLPGLAQQVAAGDVRYVSILIGTNDFLRVVGGVQAGLIPPAAALPALVQAEAQAEANLTTAVKTLLAANPNVDLVVFTIPDVSLSPVAQQQATNPLAKMLLAATSQAIQKYNASAAALAATDGRVALADLAGAAAMAATSPTGTLSFGGQTISLLTPGDDFHDFFLADGVHVGTVAQGIIADLFTLAIADKFGGQTFPPTPPEIIRFARALQRHTTHGHA